MQYAEPFHWRHPDHCQRSIDLLCCNLILKIFSLKATMLLQTHLIWHARLAQLSRAYKKICLQENLCFLHVERCFDVIGDISNWTVHVEAKQFEHLNYSSFQSRLDLWSAPLPSRGCWSITAMALEALLLDALLQVCTFLVILAPGFPSLMTAIFSKPKAGNGQE